MKDRLLLTLLLVFIISVSYGQRPKFKKVSKEELMKAVCEYDSTANAEYLYHGCSVVFEYDVSRGRFNVNYYFHDRIKIYNEEGIELANHVLNYYKVENKTKSEKIEKLEGYTFNIENGKTVKTKLEKNNVYDEEISKYYSAKKFAMPAIKEGSVLDIKYKLSSPYYFRMNQFYFQKDVPVKYTEYKIAIPEYFNYNFNVNGLVTLDLEYDEGSGIINYSQVRDVSTNDIEVNRQRTYGKINYVNNIRKYSGSKIASINDEPYVYSMDNFKSSVRLELLNTQYPNSTIKYYTKTWDDIAELLDESSSFGGQLKKNYKQMSALLSEVEAMEENEKIAKIFSAIQQKYTWNSYTGSSTDDGIKSLIEEGTGNTAEINLLLVNLLQKAGVNAFPMVCKRRKSGYLNLTNPTIAELDNVIAVVVRGDEIIYLDATDKIVEPGMVPPSALNLKGVVIMEKQGQEIPIINHNKGSNSRVYTLSLEGDDMVGTYKQSVKGYNAYLYRYKYNDSENMIAKLSNDKISISNSEVNDFANLYKPISINSDIKIKGYTQEIDNKIFIDLMVGQDKFVNKFQSKERTFALFFDSKRSETNLVKIAIPEGYQVETMPETLNVSCEGGAIKYLIKPQVVGNELVITIRHQIKETIIGPEYYQSVKLMYETVEAKTKEKIVLSKI